MSGLKLYDYEDAYIEIEEGKEKYYLKEYDAELAQRVAAYDQDAIKGDRASMEMQLHLLTGIPVEELKKLAQYKLNAISQYCVQQNVERKKKEKKPKKSE